MLDDLHDLQIDPKLVQSLIDQFGHAVPVMQKHRFLGWRWSTRKSWLWIDDLGLFWHIRKTSGPQPYRRGSLIGIDVMQHDGRLSFQGSGTGCWAVAITMWPVKDPKEARRVFLDVAEKIKKAAE